MDTVKTRLLCLFVDALSWYSFMELQRSLPLPLQVYHPVQPGLGYSSNLHWHMFKGKSPDAMGFFCDWALDLSLQDSSLSGLVFSLVGPFLWERPRLNAFVHRGLKRMGLNYANLPLHIAHLFRQEGSYLMNELRMSDDPDTFRGWRKYLSRGSISGDETVLAEVGRDLRERSTAGNVFVSLTCLDLLGHAYGPQDPRYLKAINRLWKGIADVVSFFLDTSPEGTVILLSDHGMVPTRAQIFLNPERFLGRQSIRSYVCYFDSVYIRAWCFDRRWDDRLREYLSSVAHLRILTAEERKLWGVSASKFGDIIGVLEEGFVFNPNYFQASLRLRAPRGMHGYLAASPRNMAVVAASKVDIGDVGGGESPVRHDQVSRFVKGVASRAG